MKVRFLIVYAMIAGPCMAQSQFVEHPHENVSQLPSLIGFVLLVSAVGSWIVRKRWLS